MLETRRRILSAAVIALFTWIAFVMLSRPVYSFQMISSNPLQLYAVLSALVWNQQATYGFAGVVLPAVIAALVGFLTVITGIAVFKNYRSTGSVTGTLGGAVGFAGAGCASCGAGLLTLLGLSGGVALLPFDGLGVQALSIAILFASLEYTGRNQGSCSV